ncbi:hypothetical protein C8Q77DRAFT_1153873 [Trametes polyzona]|nr:hypothetical protein C8Q77DRAFT_1153873 [Trametes polyzona]
MAKVKKQKAKPAEPDQHANVHAEPSQLPPALHPSHDVTANSPAGPAGGGYDDWGAPTHTGGHGGGGGGWGTESAAPAGNDWGPATTTAADDWGPATTTAADDWGPATAPADEWGAPAGGGDDWPRSPARDDQSWGPSSPLSISGGGGYGTKKSAMKKGGAQVGAHGHSQQPAPPHSQAPAPTSFHPAAAAQMASSRYGAHHASQDWGAPTAPAGWTQQTPWAPPAPPKPPPAPPAAKPAWANWAHEAKILPMVNSRPSPQPSSYGHPEQSAAAGGGARQAPPEQQRSQILSSLLQDPNQYAKDYLSQAQTQAQATHHSSRDHHGRAQQYPQPGQQMHDPHFIAEQQSILRSIQEARSQSGIHGQQHRPQPIQQADSWGYGTGWGERASTIPEEDEYDDEDDEDEDGWGHGGGGSWGHTNNGRVRFSPNISYSSSPRRRSRNAPSMRSTGGAQPHAPPQGNPQQFWAPLPTASKTMKIATGAISTGSISTTVFELPPPRQGMGENGFVDSQGAALKPAERALFNRERPAKERFRWGFNPDKDPRVGSLLRWIASMSSGLATIGLKRFLETRERGALFANADFRVPSQIPGMPPQPTFDYVTLDQIQRTLDATLQESVALYHPAYQVIVFVFLLSPSGNSMALWRRKLEVPEAVRAAHHDEIIDVMSELKEYPVYVDELPVKPDEAAPKKKKKVRFAFLRRLFGGGKKSAAAT